MKKSLETMGSKIDVCTKAVEGLTKKIPQWVSNFLNFVTHLFNSLI
jgi:hypothetical protein